QDSAFSAVVLKLTSALPELTMYSLFVGGGLEGGEASWLSGEATTAEASCFGGNLVWLYNPGWSAMAPSQLIATSASWVQVILLPQPPE
uniref:Uncharacterized protein n=1 Tax=Theropithecus gelada TaxID=9565 RepID=A0A8D2F259_THEGE